MDKFSLKIPHKDLSPEGTSGWIYAVPEFEGEKIDDHIKLKDNEFREFQIKALLNKHPSFSLKIEFELEAENGNSYLLMPNEHDGKRILNLKIYTPSGEFFLNSNKGNELSLISFNCKANNHFKAVEKFHTGITPYFDFLSYKNNVPISIDKVFCLDTKYSITSISYVAPYLTKSAILPPNEIPEEMIPIFALFREAKTSSSPYYQFLCYFKILEGIYRKLRPSIISQLKEKKIIFELQKEIVPSLPELRIFKSAYIGKSIHSLFQSKFEKEYRHAISHFSLNDGTLLNLSDNIIMGKYENIIYLIEVCCRVVIESQLNLINSFKNN